MQHCISPNMLNSIFIDILLNMQTVMFVSTNSHHRLTNNLANDTGEEGGRVSDRRQWVETPKNNSRHRSLLIFIYPSAQSANIMHEKLTFRMTFQRKFSFWISGPILKKTAPDMKTFLTGVKTPHQTRWCAIITDNTPRRWAHKASFQRLCLSWQLLI